jgi:hypothetical protein
MRLLVLLISLTFFSCRVHAESIVGDVIDIADRKAIHDVAIHNIHTDITVGSDAEGKFSIVAARGHLLEFRKLGYKTLRVRIPAGSVPPYFKIVMEKGPVELPQFDMQDSRTRNYKKDSLTYYELYKHVLEFPKLTGLDVIRHPFSALSKKNRQIWAFQEEYTWFEQQKYIDYTFNEKLIKDITGLSGDSLQLYMKRFRPTYEQLRATNEYGFYLYIKETGEIYRTGRRFRQGIRRSAN